MARKNSQLIGRRRLLSGLIAVGTVLNLPLGAGTAMGAHKGTPSQSLGPFYPTNWRGDVDSDLVRVHGRGGASTWLGLAFERTDPRYSLAPQLLVR